MSTAVKSGRVLSGLVIAFLTFDAVMKFTQVPEVVESFTRLGWQADAAAGLGALQLLLVAAHLVPRTSVLGAVLLTGYLGGAVAMHLRIGDPLLCHVLFPVYMGVLLWGGLWLRRGGVRAVLPLAREPAAAVSR